MTTVELVPMDATALREFIATSSAEYVESRVEAGETREQAERAAEQSMAAAFPNGTPAAGHRCFHVRHGGAVVGRLWIGPEPRSTGHDYWVFDIEIAAAQRGLGYGRAAMVAAESAAAAEGATRLGLNVFGFNAAARRLYESLGYETRAIQMSKALPAR